jgi:hypothetical protein
LIARDHTMRNRFSPYHPPPQPTTSCRT